jgi:predicted phage tail component-like protein
MSFRGLWFDRWLIISKITRPSKSREYQKAELTSGDKILYTKDRPPTIAVEGWVMKHKRNDYTEVKDLLDEMKRVLYNDSTDGKLIFSDQDDRYWEAKFEGEVTPEFVNRDAAKVELTFALPDGVAYAIEYDVFTNAVPEQVNLFLDSEFENYRKYFKDWVKRDGTYNGSNVVSGDFRGLITLYGTRENWFPETALVTRPVEVKVGDYVSFAVWMNIKVLSTNSELHGRVILEERSKAGGSILKRHIVDPEPTEGEWQNITGTIQITSEDTTALCLTFGVYGDAYVSISRPQFNLGPTLNPYTPSKLTVSDTVEVTNAGTDIVYPEIDVSMQGENGLVGVVNSNGGVLQFGNPGDVDIQLSVRTDRVIDFGMRGSQPELTLNDTSLPSLYPYLHGNTARPNLIQGDVAWDKPEEVYPVFRGVGDIGVWHGPKLSAQIPKSRNNTSDGDFLSAQRFGFTQNGQTARARMEFVIADENKNVFMGMIVRDSTTLSSELIVEFWYKDKMIQSTALDRRKFNGNFFQVHLDRMKQNTELRWQFGQIRALNPANDGAFTSEVHEFIMKFPERELTNAVYFSTWFMRYSNQHVLLLNWTDSKFLWTNQGSWTNIENLFDDKDQLSINTKTRKIMLNNVENRELHKLGNQYNKFQLGYGNHEFKVVPSEWALPPIVTVKIQKTFL